MRTLSTIIYAVAVLAVVAFAYRDPEYNWDMLPYMALALSHSVPNADSVHARTYGTARVLLPAAKYNQLIDSSNIYRLRTHREPATFTAQLGYYAIKPLYIISIHAFHTLGVPLPKATVMPSLLGFLLIAVLLFIWTRRVIPHTYAILISLALLFAPFMLQSVRAATPDLLAGAFLLWSTYLLIEKRSHPIGLLLLAASVFVRVDAVLFALCILLYLFYFRLLPNGWIVAAAVAVVAAAGIVLIPSGVFGEILVVRPASERLGDSVSGSVASHYLSALRGGLASLLYSNLFPALGVACAAILMRVRLGWGVRKDGPTVMIVLMLVHIALRLILHPIVEDRFLIADYIVIAICALTTLGSVLDAVPKGARVA
jgi:hypothetical protein